jgi:hypothetical protein
VNAPARPGPFLMRARRPGRSRNHEVTSMRKSHKVTSASAEIPEWAATLQVQASEAICAGEIVGRRLREVREQTEQLRLETSRFESACITLGDRAQTLADGTNVTPAEFDPVPQLDDMAGALTKYCRHLNRFGRADLIDLVDLAEFRHCLDRHCAADDADRLMTWIDGTVREALDVEGDPGPAQR